jgi:DNA polymerase-1
MDPVHANRMLLIDATGLIFRAYFSIKGNLSYEGPEGKPVAINAVFGLVRFMLKLYKDFPARASALIFDAGSKTFRNDLFAEYKAHRPPPPPDMAPQFGLSIDTAKATEAPTYLLKGYEADDIICTLTHQALACGMDVTILTGDRDILQMLAPKVEVLLPGQKGEFQHYRFDAFQGEFGFPVDRFVDYKALRGDPSDNIPGIAGIGEKTAAKLVATYGKLEQIYENLDMVKPDSVRAKLKDARDKVMLYRQLCTLCDTVPVLYDFEGRTMPNFGGEVFQAKCAEFGFGRVRDDAAKLGDLQLGL